MRFIPLILTVTLIFCYQDSWAEDAVDGRIVSLDLEKGQIILTLIDRPDLSAKVKKNNPLATPTEKHDKKGQTPQLSVFISQSHLPCRAVPGALVRIWGDYDQKTGRFTANKIFPLDPTGVRRRLGRGCGQCRGMCR